MKEKRNFTKIERKLADLFIKLTMLVFLIVALFFISFHTRDLLSAKSKFFSERKSDILLLSKNPLFEDHYNYSRYGLLEEKEETKKSIKTLFSRLISTVKKEGVFYDFVAYFEEGSKDSIVSGEKYKLPFELEKISKKVIFLPEVELKKKRGIVFVSVFHDKDQNGVFTEDEKIGTIVAGFFNPYYNIWSKILISALITFFAFIVSIYFFSAVVRRNVGNIISPINDLVNLSQKVKNGDYTQRIEAVSDDEIGILAESFNEMLDSIEAQREELKREREKFKNLFDFVPKGIILVNSDFTVIDENEAFRKLVRGSFLRRDFKKIFNGKGSGDVIESKIKASGRVSGIETTIKDLKGNIHHVVVSGQRIPSDEELCEIVFDDITELKEYQLEILKLKNLLNNVIESSPNGIITISRDGKVLSWNRTAEKFTGLKKDEVIGRDIFTVSKYFREYRDIFNEILEKRRIALIGKKKYERNGKTVINNLTLYPLITNGIEGGVFVIEDVTEKEKLQQQLIQSQKLEAVGTLAGGFAHDFNNFLSGISGYVSLIKMASEKDKIDSYAEKIDEVIKRAKDIINHILVFTRKEEAVIEPIEINDILKEIVSMLKHSFKRNIKIDIAEEDKFNILGDKSQLSQVFLNILINSRDAIEEAKREEGKIKIIIRKITVDEDNLLHYGGLPPGEYVRVDIEDNGEGIPENILGKIFEPFFTTKPKGKGTGLGLSMAYGIVRNHGGQIRVYSRVGIGSTFSVILPLSEKPVLSGEREKTIHVGEGTILVVDDEDYIRDSLVDFLTRIGYKVYSASNGKEAIKEFEKRKDEIDLVLIDLIMPELDGFKTLRILKKIKQSIKSIMMSGFIGDEREFDELKHEADAFIMKPVGLPELSEIISKILGFSE